MPVKTISVALLMLVTWCVPAAAATIHTSCAAAAEAYTSLYDEDLYDIAEPQEAELQRLRDITATTIDLLGFFGSVDHCAGPFGTALVCATANKLLNEIDHQHNQSMAKWQSEAARPPLVKQITDQFDVLRARYTRACVVPNRGGQLA